MPARPRSSHSAWRSWPGTRPALSRLRHRGRPRGAAADAARPPRAAGRSAVEPLCVALLDRDPTVIIAAAESLGHLGDERAVQPLTEALRDSFIGRSGRKQLVIGVLVLVAAILLVVFFLASAI